MRICGDELDAGRTTRGARSAGKINFFVFRATPLDSEPNLLPEFLNDQATAINNAPRRT